MTRRTLPSVGTVIDLAAQLRKGRGPRFVLVVTTRAEAPIRKALPEWVPASDLGSEER